MDGSLLDEEYNDCQSPYPASLEGLYICGRDEVIDGAFGVLGYAGVSYFYDVGVDGEGTGATLTGYAVFDVDDITSMVNDGTWTGVILHEIGHGANLLCDDLCFLQHRSVLIDHIYALLIISSHRNRYHVGRHYDVGLRIRGICFRISFSRLLIQRSCWTQCLAE